MAIEQVNVGGPLQAPVAPYVDGGVGVTLNNSYESSDEKGRTNERTGEFTLFAIL